MYRWDILTYISRVDWSVFFPCQLFQNHGKTCWEWISHGRFVKYLGQEWDHLTYQDPDQTRGQIFRDVGMVMSDSRSQPRDVTNHVWVCRRDMWGSKPDGSQNNRSIPRPGLRPDDRSGSISAETKILRDIGMVMLG